MHARELIELAGLVSAHGPLLMEAGRQIPQDAIERYWISSKVRLERWAAALKVFGTPVEADCRQHGSWPQASRVIEEILASEVLTRVWTTVLCGHDRQQGCDDAEPVARSVMIGQMEARHRALTLLVHSPAIESETAVKLNRLRQRAEHWTDLLVGYLASRCHITEFAADPERAEDFAEDLGSRGSTQTDRVVWPFVIASLRVAFPPQSGQVSPNPDLNARIAGSILACFPAELFGATGMFHSLWLRRLMNFADDAQGMIDDLLSPDLPSEPASDRLPHGFPEPGQSRFGR